MHSQTKTVDVVIESRRVIGGVKRHCHRFGHILQDLQVIMKKERKKIAKKENSNDGSRLDIEETAGPVIRMADLEDKIKAELNSLRRFASNLTFNANRMEELMNLDQAGEEAARFDQQQQDDEDDEEEENQRQAGQFDDDDDVE